MTLNSHLPLRDEDARGSTFDCARHAVTREDDMLSRALEAVARVALDPAIPPTAFAVVGDHAQPLPVERAPGPICPTHATCPRACSTLNLANPGKS